MILSRRRVRDVLEAMNIPFESSLHGFELNRETAGGARDHWRLQHGGGIAGNGDRVWWLTKVAAPPADKTWNLCVTKGQLVKELQRWKYTRNGVVTPPSPSLSALREGQEGKEPKSDSAVTPLDIKGSPPDQGEPR